MQQRAACSNNHAVLADSILDLVDDVKRAAQVILPDITSIHYSKAQRGLLGQQTDHILIPLGSTYQVYVQHARFEFDGKSCVIGQSVKIGSQDNLESCGTVYRGKCLSVCVTDGIGDIGIKERFIYLNIFSTGTFKLFEDIYINRQKPVKQLNTIKTRLLLLSQKKICDRADKYRLCPDAKLKSLLEFGYSLIVCEFKLLVAGKFRDDIMVVCIKPFGHLHGCYINTVFLVAVSHCKI